MTATTKLDSAQTIAREQARLSSGQFGTQEHTAPEATLSGPTPRQLAAAGFGGPASENVFAEPWDKDEMRPLRPYLPLTPGDDDEFFDARPGTRVTVVERDGNATRIRSFVRRANADLWEERSELRDVFQRKLTAGDVWMEMFEEDGSMRSALLHAPEGTLFSDERYYVARDEVDKPLTVDDAIYRLSGARRGQLVSRSTFGDVRDDGVPEAFQGELALELRDNGFFSLSGIGKGRDAKRGFPLDRVQIFDRDGDLVFRMEHDHGYGYGWEEVLRITD